MAPEESNPSQTEMWEEEKDDALLGNMTQETEPEVVKEEESPE